MDWFLYDNSLRHEKVKVTFNPKILIKLILERSLQIFLKTWTFLTLNLYDMVSAGEKVLLGNNIRYFTSQIVVNHLDVNELMKKNLHMPRPEKTFHLT